ncbi:hypothetical protein BKA70DRAFT_1435962 [Coprinopsis sp. MPI-PUGE-AT-0042]|nr:hypothetical protein BKA70DRAFT_1435962 [Coprinopsis sp. MPI-PUGE-AT-0042]
MHFTLHFFAAMAAIALTSLSNAATTPASDVQLSCGRQADAVPLFRSYNPRGDHFYTINSTEHSNAIRVFGYLDQGLTGYLFPSAQPHAVPLYRLFSDGDFDHFYTTDLVERDRAISVFRYVSEGVAGYIYPDAECGGLPLFRVYQQSLTDHIYTMSQTERDFSVDSGALPEGITGYMFAV